MLRKVSSPGKGDSCWKPIIFRFQGSVKRLGDVTTNNEGESVGKRTKNPNKSNSMSFSEIETMALVTLSSQFRSSLSRLNLVLPTLRELHQNYRIHLHCGRFPPPKKKGNFVGNLCFCPLGPCFVNLHMVANIMYLPYSA